MEKQIKTHMKQIETWPIYLEMPVKHFFSFAGIELRNFVKLDFIQLTDLIFTNENNGDTYIPYQP